MSKKKNEIAVTDNVSNETTANTSLSVPSFMAEDARAGTERLAKFIQPPRIKVIQPLTKPPLIDMFNPGDMVVLPINEVVASLQRDESGKTLKQSDPFRFVPIFFFPEWVVYNPQEIRQQHGAIRERTFDSESPIAYKSKNKATRTEPCPEMKDKNISYVEVLNYAISIFRDGQYSEPAVLQFKSGEHNVGTAFNTLIRSRKAPIFGCVFEGRIGYRSNTKGQWFGVDVMNPQSDPWVTDRAQYEQFRSIHEEFEEFYQANAIVILEDEDDTEDSSSDM